MAVLSSSSMTTLPSISWSAVEPVPVRPRHVVDAFGSVSYPRIPLRRPAILSFGGAPQVCRRACGRCRAHSESGGIPEGCPARRDGGYVYSVASRHIMPRAHSHLTSSAAVAAFDPAAKKLTHIVVVSPGCDYDETTRVYVRSPEATGRYACTYTLTGARAGGRLVKRGLYGLNLHGTNTYTGGTVVECGQLYMKGEKSFPANTPLKVMDGATFDNNKRGLAVSVLGGAGGTVVNCPSVTVGKALEITAAELFAASGPLAVQGAVAFAPGVAVRVTDPENLPRTALYSTGPGLSSLTQMASGSMMMQPGMSRISANRKSMMRLTTWL